MTRDLRIPARARAVCRAALLRAPSWCALFLVMLLVVSNPSQASPEQVRAAIMAELVEDGYRHITVGKTWLGRLRFVAIRPGARREIVVNPATGEILRDYSRYTTQGSGGGGGESYDPDDDDDDDDDDYDDDDHDDDDDDERDDERDNSGPGSENSGRDDDDTDNSGSGSSNSGSGSDNSGSGSSDDDD